MTTGALGLSHFWSQADAVSRAVAYGLLAMSVLSWGCILAKGWSVWRASRALSGLVARFWAAGTYEDGVAQLRLHDSRHAFVALAMAARAAHDSTATSIGGHATASERVMRAVAAELRAQRRRLDGGLTLLASIGTTAPFVGLFGTVWGIYHALIGIASSGQVVIERVAGPVGEALIMTAFGLAVAIPAVLAYNAFGRMNRLVAGELDGFARDLHAHFSTPH
ncbi:MAG TPA: MotA/TolQ/ExbB proton channel family protein [Burkholderiaceae bacterium]|nr:MotA/TolQ/ExbB proton channel family protein [Burkholderiaceae bacterium]